MRVLESSLAEQEFAIAEIKYERLSSIRKPTWYPQPTSRSSKCRDSAERIEAADNYSDLDKSQKELAANRSKLKSCEIDHAGIDELRAQGGHQDAIGANATVCI